MINERQAPPTDSCSTRVRCVHDEAVFAIEGYWQDTIKYDNGRIERRPSGVFSWGKNQIQNTFATLLASWCRAESGYDRISYAAVGSGLSSWDTTPPTKSYSDTTLTTESFRKAVPQGSIVFIDPSTDVPTGGTPSSKLEISYSLLSGEANGTLREFALFGGDATIATDSGQMVNWVDHNRIDKDSSMEIQRIVRIEFVTL